MQIFSYVCYKISLIIDDFWVIHYTKSVTYRQLYQNRNYYIGLVSATWSKLLRTKKYSGHKLQIILPNFIGYISPLNIGDAICIWIFSRWRNSFKLVPLYFRNCCTMTPTNVYIYKVLEEKNVIYFKDSLYKPLGMVHKNVH